MRIRSRGSVLSAVLAAVLLLSLGPPASAGPDAAYRNGGVVLVGVGSRSVLPTVSGSHDYLHSGLPDPQDPYSIGVFVPRWDQGRVAVGNGDDRSFWVHDDVRVRALAIDDPGSAQLVVLVSADLYMIFKADGDEIRAKVAQRLGRWHPDRRLEIVIAATHNHHGPDTAFGVNHTWYEYLTDQAADAVVDAVRGREPARLRVASGSHYFGANDTTDPQIYDPTLSVLQAVRPDGRILATVVQWNNHPEATLGWSPPVPPADCAALQGMGESCATEGRYFTADYAGVVVDTVRRLTGAEALFFNGALGVLIGPGGATLWEVDEAHPLGNEFTPPAGAVAPGGGTNYTDRNFRRAVVLGEQVAFKALTILGAAEPVTDTRMSYVEEPFFTRLSNAGFRYLLVNDASGRPRGIGHNSPMLYTCPATGPKTATTCTPDRFTTVADPVLGEIRAGDHLRTLVGYLSIGRDVAMVTMPAEVPGELTMGLPAQFRTDPDRWYQELASLHARGDDFQIPGYLRNLVPARHVFTIGLGNDEVGYTPALSNYRIFCVADMLSGQPGTCAQLYAIGAIEFADAVSGRQCKRLYEDPAYGPDLQARFGAQVHQAVAASCFYGQAFGEAAGHYEETNSVGWDIAADMLAAMGRLTGHPSTAQVNPAFPGYYEGYPPPA